MKITLTGASGFIGGRLVASLLAQGHELHLLGRRRPESLPGQAAFTTWDALHDSSVPGDAVKGADAVIHLAGEPVAQRWSDKAKSRIRASRIEGTRQLVRALSDLARKPAVLLSASAIGYYGDRGDDVLTEASKSGSGFLAGVCVEWERFAASVGALGIRAVHVRLGIVLGPDGGALAKMLTPFQLGVGGRIGSGRQWMSWIHVEDVVSLILFALHASQVQGALNATAPNPVRNADFTKSLGAALHRPTIFPVPEVVLKLALGEMASILTESQRVLPEAALKAGFRFHFEELDRAFGNLFKQDP